MSNLRPFRVFVCKLTSFPVPEFEYLDELSTWMPTYVLEGRERDNSSGQVIF